MTEVVDETISRVVKVIDANLNGWGQVIYDEAKEADMDLALACAVVEKESHGRNIFGCDHGPTGDVPPFCNAEVTKRRVQLLRDNGNYGHGENGIGLPQVTYWKYVERAEELGGAHLPWCQLRVCLGDLQRMLNAYDYTQALASYSAGEGNWTDGLQYAAELAALHTGWKNLLPVEPGVITPDDQEWPTSFVDFDNQRWAVSDGKFLRSEDYAGQYMRANRNGWWWLWQPEDGTGDVEGDEEDEEPYGGDLAPYGFVWEPAYPSSWNWLERHPTRYEWNWQVEALVRRLYAEFDDIHLNTYEDHPEWFGYNHGTTNRSVDVWAAGWRGNRVDPGVGQAVVDYVFADPDPPFVEWCIWWGYIWVPGVGWKTWVDDGTGGHYDHVHFTFYAPS